MLCSVCLYDDILQIEFYFGDANLQRDKFLGKKIKEHPDGCTCICTSFYYILIGIRWKLRIKDKLVHRPLSTIRKVVLYLGGGGGGGGGGGLV